MIEKSFYIEDFNEFSEKCKKDAEEFHDRMSQLFNENRFMFELERKKMIDETIKNTQTKEVRDNLIELQGNLDRIFKNSGSAHNRFVMVQTIFWDFIHYEYLPILNGKDEQ